VTLSHQALESKQNFDLKSPKISSRREVLDVISVCVQDWNHQICDSNQQLCWCSVCGCISVSDEENGTERLTRMGKADLDLHRHKKSVVNVILFAVAAAGTYCSRVKCDRVYLQNCFSHLLIWKGMVLERRWLSKRVKTERLDFCTLTKAATYSLKTLPESW